MTVQIIDNGGGSSYDPDATGHARNGLYQFGLVEAGDGSYPSGRYDAYGYRSKSTPKAMQNGGKLFGMSMEPCFDPNGKSGLETFSVYADMTMRAGHIDNHYLFFGDEILPDTGATVGNLYGLYLGPVHGATGINRAIHTMGGDHLLGDFTAIKYHASGGVMFSVEDTSSGQGFYQSNGCALNFDNVTNGQGYGIINHVGYNGGVSQPRDLLIRDGMSDDIAQFKATDKSLRVVGGFGCNGKSPQSAQASGGTLSGVIAALVNSGILAS